MFAVVRKFSFLARNLETGFHDAVRRLQRTVYSSRHLPASLSGIRRDNGDRVPELHDTSV